MGKYEIHPKLIIYLQYQGIENHFTESKLLSKDQGFPYQTTRDGEELILRWNGETARKWLIESGYQIGVQQGLHATNML